MAAVRMRTLALALTHMLVLVLMSMSMAAAQADKCLTPERGAARAVLLEGGKVPADGSRRERDVVFSFSHSKSGTTAFEWSVSALLERYCRQIEAQESGGGCIRLSLDLHSSFEGTHCRFSLEDESGSTGTGGERTYTLETRDARVRFFARSLKHRHKIPTTFRSRAGKDIKVVSINRDPLAVYRSDRAYYKHGQSTSPPPPPSAGACAYVVKSVAKYHRIALEEAPRRGIDITAFDFEDMRNEPMAFAWRVAYVFGLDGIQSKLVEEAMAATSPEHMKEVQQRIVTEQSEDAAAAYGGLSSQGVNSRKVSKAESRSYLSEWPEKVVRECVAIAREHLPPTLAMKYYGDLPRYAL